MQILAKFMQKLREENLKGAMQQPPLSPPEEEG